MTSDDKWQGYFGDMFEGREVPPEDHLWKNIASKLPEPNGNNRPKWLWWIFPVSILFIIGFGTWYYQPINDATKAMELAKSRTESNNDSTIGKEKLINPANELGQKSNLSLTLQEKEAKEKAIVSKTNKSKYIDKNLTILAQAAIADDPFSSENQTDNLNDITNSDVEKAGLVNEVDKNQPVALKPQRPSKPPKGGIRNRHNLGRTFLLAGPILQHGGRGSRDGENQDKPKGLGGLAFNNSRPVSNQNTVTASLPVKSNEDETLVDNPYFNSGVLEPMYIPVIETNLKNSVLGPEAKLNQADSVLPNPKGLIDSIYEKQIQRRRTTLYGFHAAGHQMLQTTYIRGFESIHISDAQKLDRNALQTFSLGLTAMRKITPKTDVRVRFDYFRLQQSFSGGATSNNPTNFTTNWVRADSFGINPNYQKGTYTVNRTYHLGLFSMGVQQWMYKGLYLSADAGIGYNLGSQIRESHSGYKGSGSPIQTGGESLNFGMIRLGIGYRRSLGKGWMLQMEPAIQWYPKVGGLKGDLDFNSRSVGFGVTLLK